MTPLRFPFFSFSFTPLDTFFFALSAPEIKKGGVNLLGLGVASTSLGLLKLALEVGDAVVEGDGLLVLGGKLGLESSELALSSFGAGSGGISLSTEVLEFLQ